MLIFLLILIFSRPFISSLAFPYANFIYSVILLIFLIAWLISKGISFINIRILKYPLILFCLAIIISTLFSIDKSSSVKEIYKYITGLLLIFIIASLTLKNKIKVIYIIIFAGITISLLAIYQYFSGFQNVINYISKEGITDSFALDYLMRRRVYFPFVTPNTLAGYLIMVMPLTLIIKDKKKWLILTILFFALLLTKSLGAFLSLFLASTLYFYLQGKIKKINIFFLFGLFIIMGFIFIIRSATQKEYLQPIFSTAVRLSYWRDTLGIIKAHSLAGVGLGNFNLAQSRYAHNSYLQIWAEMGILGIVSILWLIIAVFKSKDRFDSLLAANLTFLIHNLVDFTFFLPEAALIWWITLGLNISIEKDELNCCNSNL